MNVGIIVYSRTGNTLSIAQSLKSAFEAKGHSAQLERISVEGEIVPNKPVTLKTAPDAAKYDAVILAAPVMAFSLNPVMKAYLQQMGGLSDKKAGCFVTKQLPGNWTGGSRAIKAISAALKEKGASVLGTAIIHWKNEAMREKETEEAITALAGLF